jgi:hypothetical protein
VVRSATPSSTGLVCFGTIVPAMMLGRGRQAAKGGGRVAVHALRLRLPRVRALRAEELTPCFDL